MLTLLFVDVVGSTAAALALGDRGWCDLIRLHRRGVRERLLGHGGREVDTAGDGFFASFPRPGDAVRCAAAVRSDAEDLGLAVRCGIHAGECEVDESSVYGIAVHTAARVAETADSGEILLSATVRDLLAGSDLAFVDRDWQTLRGFTDLRQLFALEHK